MNIEQVLSRASNLLGRRGSNARLDAEWLLLEVIDADNNSYLIAHGRDELSPFQEQLYFELVERRVQGEPLAYILGWWEFYGRRFKVTPDVLVPRPATEGLIESSLKKIDFMNKSLGRVVTVADIGTGSGCIAITLLLERIYCKLIAADVSEAALEVAQENAKLHHVANRISFLSGDLLTPIKGKEIDLIVSNPPYVPTKEIDQALLSPTAETAGLGFEPRLALDGGSDGLDMVRVIQNSGWPFVVETVGGRIIEN